MAREYFCAYHSLLDTAKQLTDTEFGKLIRAALTYSRDHDVEPLRGREAIVWDMVKWQMDRDAAKYAETCEARRLAGSAGGKQKVANASKRKQKVAKVANTKAKEKAKETITPLQPPKGGERFDEFWYAYPRKEGKDAARKAFARRSPTKELLADMLAAIEAQKRSEQWQRDGGQFIPHPATWLNQGRWQDEVQQRGGGSKGYVEHAMTDEELDALLVDLDED